MACKASEAVPGKIYRRTRDESKGGYCVRPKTEAETYIGRIEKRGNQRSRDIWLIRMFKDDPTRVLFKRYTRGTDPVSGKKWETCNYTLLSADVTLRQVQAKPGYK